MDIGDAAFQELVLRAGSRFDLWANAVVRANARTILEIGVWKGDFAKELLMRCPDIETYYMIDPWATLADWNKPYNVDANTFAAVYAEAMEKTTFASRKRKVLRGATQDVIDEIPDGAVDFAYVDGDHTLRGITIDLIRLLPKIKPNGVIAGDDFVVNPWQHGKDFEPTFVCPFSLYFAEAMRLPIQALPFNQFVLQKQTNARFSFRDHTGRFRDSSVRSLLGAS